MTMTDGQALAVEQLREVERSARGLLEILSVRQSDSSPEWVGVEVSIYCGDMQKVPGGLPLRPRERLILEIPPDFPFDRPQTWTTHTRFAGFPHVQWKRHLCLYQAPSTEWDPSDAMFGFLDRLDLWLRQGALGQLDPVGAPLHPPVAYVPPGPIRTVVPRADTPVVGQDGWFGTAHLRIVSDLRVDLTGWSHILADDIPQGVGAAILLPKALPFEFPSKVSELLEELESQGVSCRLLLLTLQGAVLRNAEDDPLYVIIGTPMRGIRGGELRQHLASWYIHPLVAKFLRLAINRYTPYEKLREIGEEAERIVLDWAKDAKMEWCVVREDRPEIVTRRDHDAPMAWFRSRVVSIWGCGALGGHVAEFLARAGVRRLILRDNGRVAPGLLVRQLFDDKDIGLPKVEALAERLRCTRPDLEIQAKKQDILEEPLGSNDWTEGAEILIDTTATQAVIEKLELRRRTSGSTPIPVASMVIGRRAERGLAVLAHAGHSGGPADVCRRAKLESCNHAGLRAFADEFWPEAPRQEIFQPEPGCSDSTFVGSAADVAALAGTMLNQVAMDLAARSSDTAAAHLVSLPHIPRSAEGQSHANLSWLPDRALDDPQAGYEIRIAESAWSEICGWVVRSRRLAGERVETGGLLFGERDDAARVIWVSEVIGPPPDSEASEAGFVCGVVGVAEANDEKRKRTRRAVQYVGLWHTHPQSNPLPSPKDIQAMAKLVYATAPPASKSLLLIVGGKFPDTSIGAFIFSRSEFQETAGRLYRRACSIHIARPREKAPNVGLALSGGGSRAIAFHLGCLRALHDRGILDRLEVVSAVSGGAVIGGIYAYGKGKFAEFDAGVVDLLRRGLLSGLARRALLSSRLLGSLSTAVISGAAAIGADGARLAITAAFRLLGIYRRAAPDWIDRIQPPLRRWVSRTTAFEDTLRDQVFGDLHLGSERRGSLHVVFNACELRTGSAFRLGSKESGCWRFGRIPGNNVSVAHAVAASAAYPVFLPAIDRIFQFVDREGHEVEERVLLTDGGIFDNLGVTCLEPGRSAEFSYNVFKPKYIICCDAGPGLFSEHVFPYWWATRMVRSFESIFRKVQNAGHERIHRFATSGELKGFVLSYLGQRDERLPYIPPDLVTRKQVFGYPTDFSPMSKEDIDLIAARGEQLTRLLVSRYCPEL